MHPLYQDVCSVLSQADRRKGTLKRLCLAGGIRNKRATLALASETSRYADIIERCLTEAGIADQQKDYGDWMVKVLFYELLVGKGKIQGGGAVSRFVKDNAAPVKEVLEKHMAKAGVKAACELLPAAHREVIMPRYARVNTLKISVRDAVSKLEESGYKLSDYATVSAARSERRSESSIFALDGTLDDVILFPYGTDLHMHPMVTSSELRLQDKASCFPAHVMAASKQPIEVALDACSAPGNKTTHLSALMGGKGKLIAVEMDRRRSELLQNTVDIMGAANVEVQRKDFLSLPRDRKPYSEVQGIMLDPSCSGSGIVGRSAREAERADKDMETRLTKLCDFQTRALDHALGFPNVRRVVYSTCSVHRQEDEDVVSTCLENHKDKFDLEYIMPSWHRRGVADFEYGDRCVRVTHEDLTQGFFVACFVRKEQGGGKKESGQLSAAKAASTAGKDASAAGTKCDKLQVKKKVYPRVRSVRRVVQMGGSARANSLALFQVVVCIGKRLARRRKAAQSHST